MFSLRVQYLTRLEPESIPRELNEKADRLRHIIVYNNRQFFADIEEGAYTQLIVWTSFTIGNCHVLIADVGTLAPSY